MPLSLIACPACNAVEPVMDEASVLALEDIAVFTCDACSSRAFYGTLLPRIVVEQHVDKRGILWLRRRFQDPRTKQDLYIVDLDPKFAALEARDILNQVLR